MRVEKKALARAIRVLKTVVMPRPFKPVLGSVLFTGGYAYGTDLEHTIKVAVAPGAQSEPPFLIPWSAFKSLKGDTEIAPVLTDPEKPKVKIGGATLESFKIEDFPALPEAIPSRLQTVNMEHLLLHLRRCDVVRATGETARALLTGIGVCEDGAIIATDGFAVYWSDPEPCYEGRALASAAGGQGVLPGVTCAILSAFGWDHASAGAETKTMEQDSYAGGKRTTIKTNQTRWYFGSDGEAAWLRGLEGRYFAVRDLVPKEFPHTATFDRLELLQAVEEAAKVAREAPHPVILQIGAGGVRVYARQEGNEFDGDLRPVAAAGGPLTAGFNTQLLMAALGRIAEGMDEVTLEMSGATTLARVKVDEGTYCIMPLQMPGEVPERAVPDGVSVAVEAPAPPAPAESEKGPDPERQADPIPAEGPVQPAEPEAEGAPEPVTAVTEDPAEVTSDDDLAALINRAQEAVARATDLLARLLASA